jgi:PAS domain S-box-containing protein
LRENGGWVWMISRGKVVARDDQGYAERIMGIQSDLTERELATLIYQHSNQAMFVTDINNIISINPAFTAITGYQKSEVMGQNPRIFASGQDDKKYYTALWQTINNTGQWQGELFNKRKNGEVYPASFTINTVFNWRNGNKNRFNCN